MAMSLEKDSDQQSGSRFDYNPASEAVEPAASTDPQPPVRTTRGRLSAAELDDIADEFDAFLEESGGILVY